jgi:hypothetical protein
VIRQNRRRVIRLGVIVIRRLRSQPRSKTSLDLRLSSSDQFNKLSVSCSVALPDEQLDPEVLMPGVLLEIIRWKIESPPEMGVVGLDQQELAILTPAHPTIRELWESLNQLLVQIV